MTKLSDTQAVILSAASQREDQVTVLPLPETLKVKGGAVDKVLEQPQGERPESERPGHPAR